MKKLTCFKAYDIRGKLGEELNEDIAYRIKALRRVFETQVYRIGQRCTLDQ